MIDPKVTIMIPTYNQIDYICQAIDSALSQTYNNLEIIISDDCSTDGTGKLVMEKYGNIPNVKYYYNPKNIRRVANYRHLLYDLANGKYVINLDGDDFFTDKNYIKDAVKIINDDQSIDMVFADQYQFYESTGEYIPEGKNDNTVEIIDGNNIFKNTDIHLTHLTILYNREKALQENFYSKDIIGADMESIYRFVLNKKTAKINRVIGAWRKHGKNESGGINIENCLKNYEAILSPIRFAENSGIFSKVEIESVKSKRLDSYTDRNIILATLISAKNFTLFLNGLRNVDQSFYENYRKKGKIVLLKTLVKLRLAKPILYFVVKWVYKDFDILKEYENTKRKHHSA